MEPLARVSAKGIVRAFWVFMRQRSAAEIDLIGAVEGRTTLLNCRLQDKSICWIVVGRNVEAAGFSSMGY